jgi:hypothetical protein
MPIPLFTGLCASCGHVKVIQSAKGSLFVLCNLAKTDPHFHKYPVLPVLHCLGYQKNLPQPALDEPPKIE